MSDNKPASPEARPGESVMAIPGDPEQSIYRFIVVAAKRARQLQSGARPKVPVLSRKLTRVALDEVRRGLIQYVDPENAPPPQPGEEVPSDQ